MSAVEPPSDRSDDPTQVAGGAPWEPTGAVLVALTVVVVAALAAPVVVGVVHAARGSSDAAPTSAAPASSDVPGVPTHPPSASSSPSTAKPTAVCWDGSSAPGVSACSEPDGAAGLSWVFPSLDGQRCGRPTTAGPAGTVLRQVCRVRVAEGGRAVIVYAQWASSADAAAYVRSKGLNPLGDTGATSTQRFATSGAPVGKAAEVYADEPFSYIVTTPPSADPVATAKQVVRSRPADQVRGERAR